MQRRLLWLPGPVPGGYELPLAAPRGFDAGLLGWSRVDDDGWPFGVLGDALVACARVSFPYGLRRPWVAQLFAASAWWRPGRHFEFRHVVEGGAAAFDAPYFDFHLRATTLFLSPNEGPAPQLERRDLDVEHTDGAALEGRGISGLLLPGVDGDVAGLFATPALVERVVAELRAASTATGAAFVVASSPADFRDRPAASL